MVARPTDMTDMTTEQQRHRARALKIRLIALLLLYAAMVALRAFGKSSLYDGMFYSMAKVEKSERPCKALIVCTDGNDNGSNVSYGRVVDEVQSTAVLLYFIAIGSPILVDSHTL